MSSLRERTLRGLGWSGATRLLGQLLQMAAAVALARLLSPRDYGLLGMVLVFTGFAASLADMGLGASIIQRREVSERHLNSVFWLNLTTGFALAGLFVLLAPWVARFYGEPQLRWLTLAVAAQFPLVSLNVVHIALLEKALNFRTKFWIETVAVAVGGIAGLALALAGAGVWSLVAQTLGSILVRVLMLWRRASWRPSLTFDWPAVRELLRFGGHLTGFGAVIYWSSNIDKLVIGRSIGSASLGVYSLADRLMRLPLTNVTDITQQVMFPVLSTIHEELAAVQRAYLRGVGMIALLTFPLMVALSVLAEPAILVVYGPHWRASIPILQLLCFAGLAQSVYNTASWIFLSQGRSDTLFRLGVYTTGVRAVGVLVGAHWGLTGVAWAYVLGTYGFVWYPTWRSAARLVHLTVPVLLRQIAGPAVCAAALGVALGVTDRWLFVSWPALARLTIQALLGATLYLSLVRMADLTAWADARALVLEMRLGRSRVVRWLMGANTAATT